MKIKKTRIEHKGYTEWKNYNKRNDKKYEIEQIFGRWQYLLECNGRTMSIINLSIGIEDISKGSYWEVAELFKDSVEVFERFSTKKEAMAFAKNELKSVSEDKNEK